MYKITAKRNDKREPGLWVASATRGWVSVAEDPEPDDQQHRSNHIQQRCPKKKGEGRKDSNKISKPGIINGTN